MSEKRVTRKSRTRTASKDVETVVRGPVAEAVRRLLHSSWRDIDFEYEGLTHQEKACISKEEHAALVDWVKTARMPG